MKKAMDTNQMFIYVASLVIIGLVLLFGVRAVMDWQEQAERVSYLQFRSEVTHAIDDVATDYGAVKKASLRVPAEFNHMCFVDLDITPTPASVVSLGGVDVQVSKELPLIYDAWGDKTANIFLVDTDMAREPFLDPRIEVPSGIICIDRQPGGMHVRLEGMGKQVKVSRWADP